MPLNSRDNAALFGREPDLQYLTSLPNHELITAVIGRPKMGKTWLLNELGYRLNKNDHLVGFHEIKGGEQSALLYGLLDAYRGWFQNKTRIQEFYALVEKNKTDLPNRIFKLIVSGLEKLPIAESSPEIRLVISPLKKLLEINDDFTKEPLNLQPLNYDEALKVVNFLYKITNKKPCLILDAWEMLGVNLESEALLLRQIITHKQDWPPLHIYLGIRYPNIRTTKNDICPAYDLFQTLKRESHNIANDFDIPMMHLDHSDEQDRLLQFLFQNAPETKLFDRELLLRLIDKSPARFDALLAPAYTDKKHTIEGLIEIIGYADNNSYPEFPVLFKGVDSDQFKFATNISIFPRLDDRLWSNFHDILLENIPTEKIDELRINNLFDKNDDPPGYGHDTRHFAAGEYIKNTYKNFHSQQVTKLAISVASTVKYYDDLPELGLVLYIISYKHAKLFSRDDEVLLKFFQRIDTDNNSFMLTKEDKLLMSDIVLREPELLQLYCMVILKNARYNEHDPKTKEAITEYKSIAEMQTAPDLFRGRAYNRLGYFSLKEKEFTNAKYFYSQVIEKLNKAPNSTLAHAYLGRGIAYRGSDNDRKAINDYTSAINIPNSPPEALSEALVRRGIVRRQTSDIAGAIRDYERVIDMPDAPEGQKIKALNYKAFAESKLTNITNH